MEAQCSGVAVAVCVWIPALLQVGLGHVSFTDVDKFAGASSIQAGFEETQVFCIQYFSVGTTVTWLADRISLARARLSEINRFVESQCFLGVKHAH